LRILTVTNMYPSARKEIYGTFVDEHVKATRRRGIHVDVFFTDTRGHRARYFGDLPRLAMALRTGRYDVVHAHHSYCVFQVVCGRTLARSSTPLLFTLHEGEANAPPGFRDEDADFLKRFVYWRRPKRLALQLSDLCVSVEAQLPRAVGYRGEYAVISPGVDTEAFRPLERINCRIDLALDPDERILFFPADPARPLKGADLLRRSLRFVDTPVRVVFGGAIPRRAMPIYINAADAVVQTSVYEASPTVLKEAMACNTPVVCTDVGDVAALFGNTPGCFRAPADERAVADAIEKALRYGPRSMGRDRVLALGLSVDAVADRYAETYSRLAKISHRGRKSSRAGPGHAVGVPLGQPSESAVERSSRAEDVANPR
jgi:glycosyltransferase involved in cell wall biosynthesis